MLQVVQHLWNEIHGVTPQSFVARARNFDWTKTEDLANLSGLIFVSVVAAVLALIVYAQLTPESEPVKKTWNAALGEASGVVSKPGSPPIPPPTEIVSLRIYPIKSCRGFEIESTRLRKTGLLLDRNWMFISKADRKFMTIRSNPAMTLVDTKITDVSGHPYLEISLHGKEGSVKIPAFPTKEWLENNTKLSDVEIWEEGTDAYEHSDEINSFFSDFFKQEVALVYKGPKPRNIAVNGKEVRQTWRLSTAGLMLTS